MPTYTITNSQNDVLLENPMPEAEYMYGCTPTAVGMILGYYDLYGYRGKDFSAMIDGDVDLKSRGTDGNAYDMDAFDTALGRAIATEDYVYRFYSRGDLDVITGKKTGSYWTTSGEEELEYSFVNGGEGPELRTDIWNCIADYLGTGQIWRGNDNLSTTISQDTTLEETLNRNMNIVYVAEELQRTVDWRYTNMMYGLYLYVESRGYSLDREITRTCTVDAAGGDFTFEDYKAEIDAGRPVLISIEGHSMVGYGYNPETNEIIFDDCYEADQRMVWGGTYHYSGMDRALQSITVIGLMACGDTDLAVTPGTVDFPEEFFFADYAPLASGDYCFLWNSISLNFTVSNLGSDACESFEVSVYVDGSLTESILILSLDGNSYEEYMDIWLDDLEPGLHTVRVVADGDNAVQELSGSNNVLEQKLMVLKNGANVVTGLKQVGPGQVSEDDYIASGWQLHVLNDGTASGTFVRGIVTNVAANGVISYLPGLAVISQGGLLQDAAVYEYGQIQLGGTAEDLHVYDKGSVVVFSEGKLTGRLTVEDGATLSMDGSAILDFDLTRTKEGAGALVNDLSAVQGTPRYTLTVSETQKRGVYALADGADEFTGTISVVNTTGDELGTLAVGETLTVGGIDCTLTLTGSALSVSVERAFAAVSSGLVLTNQTRTVGENELYRDTTVNSGGILNVDSDGTASGTTVNIGGNLNVSSGGTAAEIVENGGNVFIESGAAVKFVPNTISGLLQGKVSATVHSGTTANELTLNDGSWLGIYRGGMAGDVTINRDGWFNIYSGGTASGLTVNSGGTLHISSGGSADAVTLSSGFRLTVQKGGTATNIRMTPFEGYLSVVSGAYVTFDWHDLSGVYYGSQNRLVSHVQHLDSPGILASKNYSCYIMSGAVVSGVTVTRECYVGYGGEMKEVFLENGMHMNIYSGGTVGDVYGEGRITVYSGGTLTGRVAGLGDSSCFCHEGAVVNIDLTSARPQADARITGYRSFTGSPTFTVTVSDDQQEGVYSLIGKSSSFKGTITITNKEGQELGTLTVNDTQYISGVKYRLTTSNSNLVLKIGDKETPSPYTSDGLIVGSGMIVSSGQSFYDTLVYRGGIEVRSGTLESTVVCGRGSIMLVPRYGGKALASNTVLNYGMMRVESGGTATDTIINSGGTLLICRYDRWSFVPTAIRTTINSSGSMRVESSCFASDVTVNAGGILYVSSGAHAMAVRENGGYVSTGTGNNIIFASNTFSGLVLNGGKATVHSGTTAIGTVLNGASLEVFYKGMASGIVVNDNGALLVSSGGTAVDVDWEPFRGTITVANGATVTYASAFSGIYYGADGQLISHESAMASPVLDANHSAYVMSDGTATDPTVGQGAFLQVFSGGTASGVTEAGGYVEVMEDAEVTFQSNTFSGLELEYMSATVHSGTTAADTNLLYDGVLFVYSGGTAVRTTVNDGGELNISGGKADHTALNNGRLNVFSDGAAADTIIDDGLIRVSAGGYATGITMNGGCLEVCGGGTADTITVNENGWLYVSSGGTVSDITISQNGGMYVYGGGSADGIAVVSGGCLEVYSGGTATNIIWTPFEDNVYVERGATATFAECTGVYVGRDYELSSSALTMESVTLDDTTSMYVMKDGAARNTTIEYWGWMTVSSGGTADETTLNEGGRLEVFGGIADRTTMNGGCLEVYSGGTADRTTLNSGWMEISSGGTVNRTTVNSGCNLEISKGVIANDTTVNSGGWMEVYSGGVATGIRENGGYVEIGSGAEATFLATTIDGLALTDGSATVHSGTTAVSAEIGSGAWLEIYSGGTADHATVTSGGSLAVSSGGVATEILENGGYVEVEAGAEVTFQTNVINGLELMTYRSATVHSGTTALSAEIGSGGRLEVYSGGTADHATVASGGYLYIYSGGTADHATINSGGSLSLSGGTADHATVNSVGSLSLSGGTADHATVNSDGYFYLFSGTADCTTVASGGRLYIYSGATATNIVWTPCEGYISIADGAYVTFVSEYSGVYLGSRNKLLSQAETMESITLDSMTSMVVMQTGLAKDIILNNSCWMEVSSGGTAVTATVNYCGEIDINGGGTAVSTTVNYGGAICIYSGGTADNTTVSSGGWMHVYSGGAADNTTVSSGGWVYVSSGGTADNTMVSSGGNLSISRGGTATNIAWTPFEGAVRVADGASVTFASEYSGVYVGIPNSLFSRALTMESITLDETTSMVVLQNGVAKNTTIHGDGQLEVYSGGTADHATVSSGGCLSVCGGGTATNIVWTPCEGEISIADGASVTFASEYSGVYLGSDNRLLSRAQIMDQTVLKGWDQSMYVMSGGTADNTTVSSGGWMYVSCGGLASRTDVQKGRIQVHNGGFAVETTLNGGWMEVRSGGIAGFTTVEAYGSLTVSSGGSANYVMIDSGDLRISSGGMAENIFLDHDHGCNMFVFDGAVARNVTVGSRGRVNVSSGGRLTGIVTCRESSYISVAVGAIVDFDLTRTSPGQVVLFNDLSRLFGTPLYTVTVNAGMQQDGVYLLAAGASMFDSCITVVNTDGLELGALSTGETIRLSGVSYTLDLSNDLLFLTIGDDLTPPAQTSSGTLVESGSELPVVSGDLFYDTTILSGGELRVLSGGIAAGISVQADGRLAVSSGGTATGIEAASGAYLGLSIAENTCIAGTSAGSAFELVDGVISGYTVAFGHLDVLEGGTADGVTVKAGGSLHVAAGGTAADLVWTPCEGRVEIEDGASATFASAYSGVYYGSNDQLLSHAASLDDLSIDSAAGAYVMSGGTAANASVKAGGSLHVASGGTAADIVWTPCEGRVEIEDGASATFAGAYSGVYYGSNDRLISHAASLDDLSIDSAGTAFVMSDGVATRTAVCSGGSMVVSSGGIAFTANVCSGGRLLVGFSGLASGVTLAAEGEFRLGPGGYAIAVSVDSAGSMTVCSGGTAIAMTVNSGGRMAVRESGTVIGAVVESGGITEMNGALSLAEVSGGGRLDVLSRGSASGVIVDADGSMTIYSGGIATETVVSGLLTVSGGAKVIDTSIEQDGRLLVCDGIIENASVRAGGTLIVSSAATLTGHLACEDGSVISVSGQATLNLDLSRLAPGSEWMIGDLSLVEGAPVYTVTVNAAEQLEGLYLLADGASAFDQSITVRNTDGTLLGTLSAGETFDVSGTAYTLRLSGSQLVLSIGGSTTSDPDTTSGLVIYDSYGKATVSSRTVLDTLIRSGSMIVSDCGVANHTTVIRDGILYVSFGGIASDTVLKEHGLAQVLFGGTMNGVSVNDDCSLHILSRGLATDVTVNSNGYVKIRTGGSASNVRIGSEGAIWLYGGACVSDLVIDSGGYLELSVSPETDISGTYAGSDFVVKNGLLSDFRIDSGTLYITSGTTADNIIINPEASVKVYPGGTVSVAYNPWMISSCVKKVGPRYYYNSSTIRYLDRDANVYYGGTTSGLIRKADELDSMTVTSGNSLIVYQDGSVRDMTVRSGGSMIVLSGATMTGQMTFENGADVSAEDGAVLHFDLTGAAAGKAALVNDLFFIQGSPLYVLTVSGSMPNGVYSLADNAAGFTGTISVTNEDGGALGMLAVGETLRIGEVNFTLNLTDSLLSVTVDGPPPPPPANLNGTSDKVSWKAVRTAQCILEFSTDGFEHVIQVVTTEQSIDMLDLPAGTYQWRVRADDDNGDWTVGETFVSETESDTPKAVQSNEDGNDDLFFASTSGTWDNLYYARNVGSINDWNGTNEIISARGRGRIQNLFFGSADPNVLCLTDGDTGDAIFVDDVYTELPEEIETNTARLFKIQEIRAGAGNDIVDMTSNRFEYTGDGLTIRGGDGNDTIWANKGDNFLFGDAGNDRIVGASGNDVIVGGIGNDRMHGGGGSDVFTFCDNWGSDTVEQLATGTVTLWFAGGSKDNWNAETLTYTDGENSVRVKGVTADQVALKFGDDGSDRYVELSSAGAFAEFTSQKIFEESGKGILASL